jgi:hypothetical protein
MLCPICETTNDESALECESCGRQLLSEAQLVETIRPIEGLEEPSYLDDTRLTPEGDPLEGVEPTMQESAGAVAVESIPIEPTLVAGPRDVPLDPLPADFDVGRESDDLPRTPAPGPLSACPWCGQASPGRICESCGRRVERYSNQPEQPARRAAAADDSLVLCPSCLGRVKWDVRCNECGVPMKPRE